MKLEDHMNESKKRLEAIDNLGDDCGTHLLSPVNEKFLKENYHKISHNGFCYNYCLSLEDKKVVDNLKKNDIEVNLFTILLSDKPSELIRKYENEIFNLIPEFKDCKGFKQNNEWHIYDVYEHTLHVIDNVPTDIELRLAALFHDLGKPLTYTEDENRVGHFYNHYMESEKIFSKYALKFNLDKHITNNICNLIYYHDINVSKLNDDEIAMLLELFGQEGINKLYLLKRSDLLAQNEKYHYILADYDNQKNKILFKCKVR